MPSSVPSPSVGTCEVMRAIWAEREDVYRDLGDLRGRQAGSRWLESPFLQRVSETQQYILFLFFILCSLRSRKRRLE